MTDVTVSDVSEAYLTWVGASGSGLSARASFVVETLNTSVDAKTAAANAYVQQIGEGMRNYAQKAQFYADSTSAIGSRSVYATAAEYYAREANKLLESSIDAMTRLNNFTSGIRQQLSNPLLSNVARAAGPLIDAIQFGGSILTDGFGSDKTAQVATGIAASEVLGIMGGVAGAWVAGLIAAPAVIGIGVGVAAGAFIGSAYGTEIFDNIIKPVAEKVPPGWWDAYFDAGGKVAATIPNSVWDTLFPAFDAIVDAFSNSENVTSDIKSKLSTASTIPSPIILDLDGDGVETTAVINRRSGGVHFDHAADGFAEQTGWVGKDDGLLVRDLDGDGFIETGRELFGSETLLTNGTKAANGFTALAELDSNGDGKISAADTAFGTLRVWKDANGDGVSSAGELLSLSDAGVQSINLGYTNSSAVDANGNQHQQVGSYTTTTGTTRTATDVWFKTNQTFTIATEWMAEPDDIAVLPDATGYGKVYDLHQAMVRDSSGALKSLVTQFTQATSASAREALTQSIIYQWTGVQNIDPASRSASMIYGNAIGDARKLEALEQFMGEEWFGVWCWGTRDPNPHGRAAPVLLQAWSELQEMVYGQLMAQSHLKPLFDKINYQWNPTSNSLVGNMSEVATVIAADLTESPRILRRLQPLRRWSHEQEIKQVFPGSPRTCRAHGARAPWRIPIVVGSY